jgi:hypothetical protein
MDMIAEREGKVRITRSGEEFETDVRDMAN